MLDHVSLEIIPISKNNNLLIKNGSVFNDNKIYFAERHDINVLDDCASEPFGKETGLYLF